MRKIDGEFLIIADESGREKMKSRLVEKHGDLREIVVARSILSRPIEGYFIGGGKKYIVLLATHHALESITTNIAFLLADLLLEKRKGGNINGVDCKLMLSKYCFLILPCVNPDGVELRYHGASYSLLRERQMRMSGGDFTLWQANARGVDLNHNYDAGFLEYKRLERENGITPGPTFYSGEYPESEPETRGVANLVRTIRPAAVVSLHTQGEEIYHQPRDRRTARIAERIASLCGYEIGVPEGTSAYGGLSDYTGLLGIPSFTVELGKGVNPLDEREVPAIFARVGETLAILPTLL
jgi:g-D-glutamyl-meso-diaminopimelate peptidase